MLKRAVAFSVVLVVAGGRAFGGLPRSSSYRNSLRPASLDQSVANLPGKKLTAGHCQHRDSRLGFVHFPLGWIGILRGGGTSLPITSPVAMKSTRIKKGTFQLKHKNCV